VGTKAGGERLLPLFLLLLLVYLFIYFLVVFGEFLLAGRSASRSALSPTGFGLLARTQPAGKPKPKPRPKHKPKRAKMQQRSHNSCCCLIILMLFQAASRIGHQEAGQPAPLLPSRWGKTFCQVYFYQRRQQQHFAAVA